MQILEALTNLLQCANDQLLRPVCRSFINPGDTAPHDNCETKREVLGEEIIVSDGQLWVGHITDTAGWPALTANPITCATPFAVTIELGIVRCAQSKLKDVQLIPDAALLTADAVQQEEDRVALKNAFLCCWGVAGRDLLPPIWLPINPQGGCVGGVWTLVIRDASCLCPPEPTPDPDPDPDPNPDPDPEPEPEEPPEEPGPPDEDPEPEPEPDPDPPEDPPPDPEPPAAEFPIDPGVVVDQARIDGIDITTTHAAAYAKITGSGGRTAVSSPIVRGSKRYGATSYNDPYTPGTTIPADPSQNGAQVLHRDDAIAAAAQATLYATLIDSDPLTAAIHWTNAVALCTAYSDVTTIVSDSARIDKLYSGWAACGFTRALTLLGGFPAREDLIDKLVSVYWPLMDHPINGNWQMTFVEAMFGIAVAAGDQDLLDDARDYYDSHLPACIYLASDGPLVAALPGVNNPNFYPLHWWGDVPSNRSAAGLGDGQYCEHTRDYGHTVMGICAALNAAKTDAIQGGTLLTTHATRLKTCLEFEAAAINAAIDLTGVPSGATFTSGPGSGQGYRWGGWLHGLSIWGASELPETAELVARSIQFSIPDTWDGIMFEGLTFGLGT